MSVSFMSSYLKTIHNYMGIFIVRRFGLQLLDKDCLRKEINKLQLLTQQQQIFLYTVNITEVQHNFS